MNIKIKMINTAQHYLHESGSHPVVLYNLGSNS